MGRYLDLAKEALKESSGGTSISSPAEKRDLGWPPESLEAERRFGPPHARLFPFIGRKVRTPRGIGTLIQVFAERVTVLLDSELNKCTFFRPCEVQPASWDHEP